MLQLDIFPFYFSGFCIVLLLLLGYLIVGGVALALFVLYLVIECLKGFCGIDD